MHADIFQPLDVKMATKKPKSVRKKKVGGKESLVEKGLSAIEKGSLAGKDPEKANYIVELLKQLEADSPGARTDAMKGLLACFQMVIPGNPEWTLSLHSGTAAPSETLSSSDKYKAWLRQAYEELQKCLRCLVSDDNPDVKVTALKVEMELLKLEAETCHCQTDYFTFPKNTFNDFLLSLLTESPSDGGSVGVFDADYLKYCDVLVFTLRSFVKVFQSAKDTLDKDQLTNLTENMYSILNSVRKRLKYMMAPNHVEREKEYFAYRKEGHLLRDDQPPPKKKEKHRRHGKVDVESEKELQRWYSEAWLTFLQLPLRSRMYKEILVYLHSDIIPHMPDPKRLIDFLTSCYDMGGVVSVLSLNGLFILIHKHHLDYPDFYRRLYSVLDPSILSAKYMPRFFHLLDIFLSSTHLPLYLVAAFVKKLSRMVLLSPPHGVIVIVVMVTNLIKRHPNCKVLLHRREEVGNGEDPFIESEVDPAKCRALESSLWEIETLKHHYAPGVTDRVCKLLSPEELAKPEEQIGEFLDLDFNELFEEKFFLVEEGTDVPMTFGPPKTCFPTATQHSQLMYKL
jgi:hypothetical protein